MKTWIKSQNTNVSHAIDADKNKNRTVCGIILEGSIYEIPQDLRKQPKCKKCLKYPKVH